MRRRSTVVVALSARRCSQGPSRRPDRRSHQERPVRAIRTTRSTGTAGMTSSTTTSTSSTTPATDILDGHRDDLGPGDPEPLELRPRLRRAERPLDQGRWPTSDLDPRRPGTRHHAPPRVAASATSSPSSIKYDGDPGANARIRLSPAFIATDDGAIIAGEPHGAATWFPANDHPSDKASIVLQGHRAQGPARPSRTGS